MTDLLAGMRLYCHPHQKVHEVPLPDVERLIYALLAAAPESYEVGYRDGSEGDAVQEQHTEIECLLVALQRASSAEGFEEFVEMCATARITS